MRTIESARWEDLALAVLLLIISVPRAALALFYERPIGAEGALSMVCVLCALLILLYRDSSRRNAARR